MVVVRHLPVLASSSHWGICASLSGDAAFLELGNLEEEKDEEEEQGDTGTSETRRWKFVYCGVGKRGGM